MAVNRRHHSSEGARSCPSPFVIARQLDFKSWPEALADVDHLATRVTIARATGICRRSWTTWVKVYERPAGTIHRANWIIRRFLGPIGLKTDIPCPTNEGGHQGPTMVVAWAQSDESQAVDQFHAEISAFKQMKYHSVPASVFRRVSRNNNGTSYCSSMRPII